MRLGSSPRSLFLTLRSENGTRTHSRSSLGGTTVVRVGRPSSPTLTKTNAGVGDDVDFFVVHRRSLDQTWTGFSYVSLVSSGFSLGSLVLKTPLGPPAFPVFTLRWLDFRKGKHGGTSGQSLDHLLNVDATNMFTRVIERPSESPLFNSSVLTLRFKVLRTFKIVRHPRLTLKKIGNGFKSEVDLFSRGN